MSVLYYLHLPNLFITCKTSLPCTFYTFGFITIHHKVSSINYFFLSHSNILLCVLIVKIRKLIKFQDYLKPKSYPKLKDFLLLCLCIIPDGHKINQKMKTLTESLGSLPKLPVLSSLSQLLLSEFPYSSCFLL